MIDHQYLLPLSIVSEKDLVEIAIIAFSIYRFICWLKQDEHKQLAWYMYAWCCFTIMAWFFSYTTISTLLLYSWPAALVLFIVVHQKTIQKRFINPQQIIPAQRFAHDEWLAAVIRHTYLALHAHKELTICIQGNNSLQETMVHGIQVNAPISQTLLQLLLTSSTVHNQSTIVISQDGQLLLYNATLQPPHEAELAPETRNSHPSHDWHQQSINLTNQYDCVLFKLSPQTHQFDIAAQGTVVTGVMAEQAQAMIARYLKKLQMGHSLQGALHGTNMEQPISRHHQ
ncbi:diadenylate cyclase [Candidatus Dependentiae bacterium]|nr:diadenylate cyclase [Candidatus Dependentiae bacterium]